MAMGRRWPRRAASVLVVLAGLYLIATFTFLLWSTLGMRAFSTATCSGPGSGSSSGRATFPPRLSSQGRRGHASEPWKTWAILAGIETDARNPAAAAEAKGKAIAGYLAFPRDDAENHDAPGRISLAVTQSLRAGDPAEAASPLEQLAADPDSASLRSFIRPLQAIVAGRRDRSLADAPDLHYSMAAEILLLIETLDKAGNQRLE